MRNVQQLVGLFLGSSPRETLRLPLLKRSLCSSTSSTFELKNVTKSNFDSALADLRRHVRDADFVAIDLEMTGVTSAPWRECNDFDRFDVQYLKVKDSAEKFAVLQFGVCPFRFDPQNHSFIAHPHNFFIFPRQELPGDGLSYEFLCQTTSIDFLAKYQFDFNTCIREGVSYLSRSQEEEALRRVKLKFEDGLSDTLHSLKEAVDIQLTRMSDILFAERMKKKINEWRDGLLQNTKETFDFHWSSSHSNQKFETIFFKMRPAIVLDGFTSHQLRLIQLVTNKHFKDLVYVRVADEHSSWQQLVVYAESGKDRDSLMVELRDCLCSEAEKGIKAAVGFRHVIDLLSSEQKLIVGHNCFLDLAHIYNKFLDHLPPTVEEYVSSLQKYFPYIIDTKVVLNADTVFQHMVKSGTSLSKAFRNLCPRIAFGDEGSSQADKSSIQVEVQVDQMRSSNWNSGAKHEAGYDAFMTGCVFAQTCSHLGVDFIKHPSAADLAQDEKLKRYMNLLYLSWISGDVIDLRTGKSTTYSSSNSTNSRFRKVLFSDIVILWGLSSKTKASEIRDSMSKVFGPSSVTSVYHLDETAAFVQFSKAEMVSDFLKLKEKLERGNDAIRVLHPLSKLLEGGRTGAANYEVYKEICNSPISGVLFADQAKAIGVKCKSNTLEFVAGHEMQEGKMFGKDDDVDVSPSSPERKVRHNSRKIDSSLYGQCELVKV